MAVLSRRDETAGHRRTTEAALLSAVGELVGEGHAFADLGIEQIVSRAGLSRPTFYAYFRDKREVVLKLGGVLAQDLRQAAGPWFAMEGMTTREALGGVLAVFREQRATVTMVVEAATYDDEVASLWRGMHDQFLPIAMERIGVGCPDLDVDARRARAFALVWATQQSLTEHLARPVVDTEHLLDQLAWLWSQASGDVG